MKRYLSLICLCLFSVCPLMAAETADARANPRLSTDEVENQVALDRAANPLYQSQLLTPLRNWRDGVASDTGLNLAVDYNALLLGVSDSPGEDSASGGVFRFYGFWNLLGTDGPNKGSLNWKVEHRHKYSDIAPADLGFASGYAGLHGPVFSDQGTRLSNLYWKQYFGQGQAAAVAGFLDVTDFVDVYLLASPWMGFTNFAFSTGSASMDLPNDATLGAAIGGMITENVYVQAGLTDANADPTDPFEGFSTFFDESDYFKWVEIGFSPAQDQLYFNNVHATLWHIDERANGTPDGWGINLSWQQWIQDTWLPFIRGGYTEDSGSLMEQALTFGFGYQPIPQRGVIGAAFHWGQPNDVSFEGAEDQYTTEAFWRYQLTKEIALTPSLQYIVDPALNPEEDSQWVAGLRVRVAL